MTIKGKLVLLRHGQTTYNEQHLMTGQADAPLTPLGEDQAREAGLSFGAIAFDKVYSSTLSRAFNTAVLALGSSSNNAHLDKNGVWDIEQSPVIMESDAGDFTGMHMDDPRITGYLRSYITPLPNGESDWQVVQRVEKFYRDEILPRIERGETVLVAAHAGIVHAFDVVMGLEIPDPKKGIWGSGHRIANATPIIFEYENGVMTDHHQLENTKVPAAFQPPKSGVSKPKP